jgi:hypothetical protein
MVNGDLNYTCSKQLPKDTIKKWNNFLKEKDKKYAEVEGLWRRTQDLKNKKLSGYKSPKDKRRKILHYINQYSINKDKKLILKNMYLWISLAYPKEEIEKYMFQIEKGLKRGEWKKKNKIYHKGNLSFDVKRLSYYKEDKINNRKFPKDYQLLDITIKSKGMIISPKKKRNPWGVLKTGIRKKDKRTSFKILKDIQKIKEFFPAQIELGCGPSIECGIPPLHYLHDVYKISIKGGKFILNPKEDTILYEILSNPEKFFKKTTKMYSQLVIAKPNESYIAIKKLFDKKLLVGEVLTNNFDKIPTTMGLKEKYLRKYEETHIIPKIKFHKSAKSLLVVGVHADRRKVQAAARKKGLKIIYIDPEGYFEKGKWRKYLMESPQLGDLVINKEAKEVLPYLEKNLTKLN